MKIYLDVLLVVNFILTMLYLRTLSKLVHRKTTPFRIASSSCMGGLFSLIMIMNGTSYFSAVIITILKITGLLLTLWLYFKYESFKQYLRYLFLYITIRIIYLGVMLIYWQISDSKKIYVRNYTIYFDISLLVLCAAVISAYGLITIYDIVKRKHYDTSANYYAVFKSGNYEIKIPAVSDSGNKLCDTFTGMPIVVFYCNELYHHFRLDESFEKIEGFRLVPFNTINGNGLMPVTSKGDIIIIDSEENKKNIKCYVGIVKSENKKSRAIFNPILLQ